jgi:hypothetical protein
MPSYNDLEWQAGEIHALAQQLYGAQRLPHKLEALQRFQHRCEDIAKAALDVQHDLIRQIGT